MCLIDDDHKELGEVCTAFRRAIIESDAMSLCIMLKDFPFGACGAASELLAKYLKNQGYGEFYYVLGERDGHSHAWLGQNGLIIDITLNQFEDYECAVFVSKSLIFHKLFEGEKLYPAGYLSTYFAAPELSAAFISILSRLRGS